MPTITMPPTWVITLPDEQWRADLGELPDAVRAVVWDVQGPPARVLGDVLADVAVVVPPYMSAAPGLPSLSELPNLRLVQTLVTGVDSVAPHVPDGVALASASGVHDASTAELAVGLALASLRGIDVAARDLREGRWNHQRRPSLADRRVLLLGTGGIGAAIADRLAPFEVTLTRVASRARDDERGHVHAVADLPSLLPEHDVVVLAVPLTEATRNLVDTDFLAAMRPGALLVNVARGGVVETAALLAALEQGRVSAALDVVDPEPLPADHPLWRAPNLLLTPHVGGDTTAMRPRALALLRDQVQRLVAGQPPRNLVVPTH